MITFDLSFTVNDCGADYHVGNVGEEKGYHGRLAIRTGNSGNLSVAVDGNFQ